MHRLLVVALGIAVGLGARGARAEDAAPRRGAVSPDLAERAVTLLRQSLADDERWIKVHAAEHLLTLGHPEDVAATFEAEQAAHGDEPEYRIGIWRVLAQAAVEQAERDAWIDKIASVVTDTNAPDRTHALESLAKLGARTDDAAVRRAATEAGSAGGRSRPYALWLLALSGNSADVQSLAELLASSETAERLVAGYALERLRPTDATVRQRVRETAAQERYDSPARDRLLAAAWLLTADEREAEPYRDSLLEVAAHGPPGARTVAGGALAERGTPADVSTLVAWLDDPDADVRGAAAAAILRIGRREVHLLTPLDGAVIGAYLLAMLGIGWFYMRRTKTDEEYLLGGRTMKPWAVGLSLFATLTSTISYLATPGEMIRHGPVYFSSVLAYPFIAVVVGWFLIPLFVRLPLTSAYEILETRLGLGVRLLGAVFFLSLRLLWMAVIIDATTRIVLVPLLGMHPSSAPYICAVLGLTTVVYTSMGGIRAVVTTDVVQTFILLTAAAVTLVLITVQLGGVAQWWPTSWSPNWDPPTLGYDPRARISLVGAIVATFFWHVCTAGSDQIAIQRYLSTRDVRSARRMFNISLVANAVVMAILALVGLALLAWFRAHRHMLGDGQSVDLHADQLFPRFIAVGLPAGLSGLVVAGLLAAAMSSLSSGLNSSCAVITVDFLDRFGRRERTAADHVRRTRVVAWLVGLVVVLLSTGVGVVQGNLLEIAFKVVNLLVAPLFGLFFMALFVRWATSFGTFVGAAFGLATVVAINYWTELTGETGISFLWSMPLGLLVQVTTGAVASLLPIGTRAQDLPSDKPVTED